MLTLLSSVGDSATLTVAHPAAPPAPNLRRCKLIGVQIRWLVIGYRCFTTLPPQDNQDNAAKVTTLQSDSRLDK